MAELDTSQSARPAPGRHVITLVKGAERWRFHLETGRERDMIDALAACADDPAHPLDWFDAAIVSHQITRRTDSGPDAPSAGTPAQDPSGGAADAA